MISPPTFCTQLKEKELLKKVKHPTRLLQCSTKEGVVHIAKHINSDVVILGPDYFGSLEQLQGSPNNSAKLTIGWTGQIIYVHTEHEDFNYVGNVISAKWTSNATLA